MMWAAMCNELEKMAEGISTREAYEAANRLQELNKAKPKADQLARGALTGAIVGPAGTLAGRAVSGDLSSGIKAGLGEAMRAPTRKGKVLGLGKALVGGIRGLGGSAASGAVFGTGLPVVRRHLDQGAEKAKLREYLGQVESGRHRHAITKALGV